MRIAAIFFISMAMLSTSAEASSFLDSIKDFGLKIKNSVNHVLGAKTKRNDGKPWFCHNLDCPQYKSVKNITFGKNKETVEERCYPQTKWARTEMTSSDQDINFGSMFRKLFKYIQGENDKKEKIEMTAPVFTTIKTNGEEMYMNMNFFIPPSQYADLPTPTDKDVKIADQDAMCVYVYSYRGWQMSYNKKMMEKVEILEAGLKENGLEDTVDRTQGFFYAGYDSPWRLLNRHNEVMLLKKNAN